MPKPPAPKLAERRQSRQIRVGSVLVGGDAPVSVQSMTTTPTTDVNATLQQIAESRRRHRGGKRAGEGHHVHSAATRRAGAGRESVDGFGSHHRNGAGRGARAGGG